ncbi:hypothetical protein, unlikely [Trypanosoma brucei gambiense DAL972]|uniref:Uncharacterized protein n=1 Tax=Trypanosoma brucei gambiense (strain MHOM/CI/86/DAL972) TaxID=679716 RepID=D0A581_TRYB9|nr:hypothetical protein, unlikely [Trypanosoma brucei gambiense DAL972]CBH16425.1 hypothetical protein, unlikely [Trypanosoma brucei gambiense DAL972]|eukprot:XP_011778689.1 hypothetical protein, unlikely [Trypanosoma brucei gambiense DAL972]
MNVYVYPTHFILFSLNRQLQHSQLLTHSLFTSLCFHCACVCMWDEKNITTITILMVITRPNKPQPKTSKQNTNGKGVERKKENTFVTTNRRTNSEYMHTK